MTTLTRYLRFNLVGALGVAVQLAALWCFNHLLADHYLWATALAIEATLLHNFLWHRRFTWRDRLVDGARKPSALQQFWRFQLSNGAVSLAGNLLLMRVLVHGAHLPVLVANTMAIVCCSAANFALSHRWAFAPIANVRRPVARAVTSALICGLVIFPERFIAAQQPRLQTPRSTTSCCAWAGWVSKPTRLSRHVVLGGVFQDSRGL